MNNFSGVWRRAHRAIALALAAAGVSACVVQEPVSPGIANSVPVSGLGQDGYESTIGDSYILRPADTLSITVFREPDLSVPELTISAEGRISVPLIGAITASGMTADELELLLEERYDERYLRSPDVAVNILEYASHLVTVEGAVAEPGLYPFIPGTRLTGGIALAAGPERVAEVRDVAIFRQGPEGMMIAKFDYAEVRSGAMLDPILHPGDRVIMGTDNLSQFWQDLLRALPAFALFTQLRL